MKYLEINNLLDINETIAIDLFERHVYPWEILGLIKDYIIKLGSSLSKDEYNLVGENIWIARDAIVAPTAFITGPTIIDHSAEIRHCAYIRGSVIIGRNAVVGNSTEIKNSILFNGAAVPHYNYIGDSILGHMAHTGAGAITSNLKSDKTLININTPDGIYNIGLRKMGAVIGDYVEVGCNSVMNPGTIIGRRSNVYPLSCVRGLVPELHIYKDSDEIVAKSNK